MKERLRGIRDKIRDETGLSSVIEVYGTGELVLTGCKGLIDFNDQLICADTVNGIVKICGRELSVGAYRADLLLVSGRIGEIYLEGEPCL